MWQIQQGPNSLTDVCFCLNAATEVMLFTPPQRLYVFFFVLSWLILSMITQIPMDTYVQNVVGREGKNLLNLSEAGILIITSTTDV